MSLLEFARGPALQWSFVIFTVGILWRLVGTFLLMRNKDLSKARQSGVSGGFYTIIRHSWPRPQFAKANLYLMLLSYTFHIGFLIVILLFVPHIIFFKDLLGFDWPGLPNNVIMIIGSITVAALLALLIRRLTTPMLRIISGTDDYISWLLTTLPVITGLMAYAHLGLRYETMLALHLLSVAALMIWFPFGKLMHAIFAEPGRRNLGAEFGRRGVKL